MQFYTYVENPSRDSKTKKMSVQIYCASPLYAYVEVSVMGLQLTALLI